MTKIIYLIIKNYLYHRKNHVFFILSYSFIFILLLVMMSEILGLKNTNTTIAKWPDSAYYYSGVIQNAFSDVHSINDDEFNKFLQKLNQLNAINDIGFEKMNHNFKIFQHDSRNLECVYINPYMERIKYTLSAGEWFHSRTESKDVIIGGKLNNHYDVDDYISLEKEDGTIVDLHIIGKLKSSSNVMLLNSGGTPMTFEKALNNTYDNIIISNSLDVVNDKNTNYCMCSIVLDIDQHLVDSFRAHLNSNESITSFDDICINSKNANNLEHELPYKKAFILLLFLEVLIVIFNETYLHIKNSYCEISTYNMLGMRYLQINIYILIPQICNFITASIIAIMYTVIASHYINFDVHFYNCYPLIMLLMLLITIIFSVCLIAILIHSQKILEILGESE